MVNAGTRVAQVWRRNKRTTRTTRTMVRSSVNSTSSTDARIVVVRSSTVSILTAGRDDGGHFGQQSLDPLDRFDDIGPRLLVNRERDRRLVVVEGCGKPICRGRYCAADIADPDRRAVPVGKDDFFELVGIGNLVVGIDREASLGGGQRALRSVGRGTHQCAANIFERQSARGELGGIDLDPDRWSLFAADGDLSDAGHLRDLLCQIVVRVLVNGDKRHCGGVRRKNEDRRVGRIELLVGRRRRHGLRQRLARRGDRGLHVLRRQIDIAVEIELNRNRRGAEGAERGHLGDAGDLADLAFERRCDRGRHGLGAGPRQRRGDLHGREIDLRQRRHRQTAETPLCRQAPLHSSAAKSPPAGE